MPTPEENYITHLEKRVSELEAALWGLFEVEAGGPMYPGRWVVRLARRVVSVQFTETRARQQATSIQTAIKRALAPAEKLAPLVDPDRIFANALSGFIVDCATTPPTVTLRGDIPARVCIEDARVLPPTIQEAVCRVVSLWQPGIIGFWSEGAAVEGCA